MSELPKIEISPGHWDIITPILQEHLPRATVWAFGSRARFAAKPYSDLDLAILAEQPLSLSQLATLKQEFTESALPFKVDLVDWVTTSDEFQKIIRQGRVQIWPLGN